MLHQIFLKILDMSIAAGYCAVFVMLARLFMKKLPKSYSYVLWAVVFLRLLMPALPEAAWSLLPAKMVSTEQWVVLDEAQNIWESPLTEEVKVENADKETVITSPGEVGINTSFEIDVTHKNSRMTFVDLCSIFWFGGCILFLAYGIWSKGILDKKIKNAVERETGIYEVNGLPTAFVTGLLKPRIYLPAELQPEYRQYVLVHEQSHLQRGDVWVKSFAYFLTSIHWFNPLIWKAFGMMCKDMEMSCDERVLRTLGMEEKKAYSAALLAIASGRRIQLGMPVAFGEKDAKTRIKNVLHYRKPTFWIAIIIAIVLIGLGLGLLSNPHKEVIDAEEIETAVIDAEETIENILKKVGWNDFVDQNPEMKDFEIWLADAASPSAYGGVSGWFEEYKGEKLQERSDVIFYSADGENLQEIMVKMLEVLTDKVLMNDAKEAILITRYLEETAHYVGQVWLMKYASEYYVMMEWDGVYRLQRQDAIMNYKEKEILFEYVPLYAEDFSDMELLSQKLSKAVNLIFLYKNYENSTGFDPKANYEDMFEFVEKGWGESGIIKYYLDETKYYKAMAQKLGLSLPELLNKYDIALTSYNKLYRAVRGDAVHAQAKVSDVEWISDYQVKVSYAFGWFEEGFNSHYFDGEVVWEGHNGEMIFVSNRRIYD